MSELIDKAHRPQLHTLLLRLHANSTPVWGKMTPQQMVEHLVESVEYTNGKKTIRCSRQPEDIEKDKQRMIYTDWQIPRNVNLGPLPERFRYPNLIAAISQLIQELDDFDKYFKEPNAASVHFSLGALNHHEWLIWHNKHFTHHFTQFQLFPIPAANYSS